MSEDLIKSQCVQELKNFFEHPKVFYKVIGNGSNLLFSDKEYEGVLINLRNFDRCQFIPNNRIKATH